jgi:hypothetical protein
MPTQPSPLGAVARGVVAGVAGTAAMTAWQDVAQRLRSAGADEDGDGAESPQDPWEQASAPAKVGRRLLEGVLHKPVPADRIGLLTNVMHWGYGTGWGALWGLVAGTARPRRRVRAGVAFGTFVWAMSYAELVPMGLYEPPWASPPQELALDLSYHLAYGAGLGAAWAVVDGR